MKRFMYGLALAIGMVISGSAIAASPIVEALVNAVAPITLNGDTICTSGKIGDKQYLTAGHCLGGDIKIYPKDTGFLTPKSVLQAYEYKKDRKRMEDWAVINVDKSDTRGTLELDCTAEVELGMEVVYAGYPTPTKFALGFGRVTTLEPMDNNGSNGLDYGMDVHAAPGASGSPVLSVASGKVIGILTEGIMAQRAGAYMVGFESIKNTDMCANPADIPTPVILGTADAAEK